MERSQIYRKINCTPIEYISAQNANGLADYTTDSIVDRALFLIFPAVRVNGIVLRGLDVLQTPVELLH